LVFDSVFYFLFQVFGGEFALALGIRSIVEDLLAGLVFQILDRVFVGSFSRSKCLKAFGRLCHLSQLSVNSVVDRVLLEVAIL
jgi:hypothetical protein